MVPLAVASPKSPLGSASSSSYDLKSPTSPEILLDLNPNRHHGIHHRQGSAPTAAVRYIERERLGRNIFPLLNQQR